MHELGINPKFRGEKLPLNIAPCALIPKIKGI